jgi:hypothetical protein
VALILLFNATISALMPRFPLTVDLTRTKIFELDAQTMKFLKASIWAIG